MKQGGMLSGGMMANVFPFFERWLFFLERSSYRFTYQINGLDASFKLLTSSKKRKAFGNYSFSKFHGSRFRGLWTNREPLNREPNIPL
jgi:hypothetical protein